ncbi:type I DNA topoisomerase [Candidatus Roizmanbacteria bacterium]|nr:type I DNA topoisomerase [Candidatus Roizmanbacteria bacterium]
MILIIVESPTKARTFNRILGGKDYYVFATMGHIRDLPSNTISIDYSHEFKPTYQIIKTKQKVVNQLKDLGKKNSEIILATDPDREGESIAYHAAYVLGFIKEAWPDFSLDKKKPLKRIVFHEITQHALNEALEHPEELRLNLVKAQQARRILDRIVGYELSPLLWKKLGKNWLSAGRVQTVALRLIVEREKEIRKFIIEDYYQIYGSFKDGESVRAKLVRKGEVSYEQKFTLKLFAGEYQYTKTTISKENVDGLKTDLQADTYIISSITEEVKSKYPPPPLTTSLLQQEGFHKFGFSSKMTMRIAQDLYERGLITYHRTDSFNLSTQFVFRAKDYIAETYGKEYALEKPRGYRTKSKMAQEAHEAIRPTKLDKNVADIAVDKKITQNHKKVYKLIFDRAVATQMKEAQVKHIKVTIVGKKGYEFESEVQQVLFDGFLKVLNPEFSERNKIAPTLKEKEVLKLESLEAQELKTNPPPRYNEATLIKMLEEKGIGRPSTYAPIISLIQDKNYVEKQFRYFTPTKLGEVISDYLSEAFPQLFNLDFTAKMEEDLDEIAGGEENMLEVLENFNQPFHKHLEEKKKDTKVIDVEETVEGTCEKCGGNLVVRYSKFGKFLACSNYPKCKFTKPFLNFVNGYVCKKCGGRLTVRFSKARRKFYGCENYPKCDYAAWALKDAVKTSAKPTNS